MSDERSEEAAKRCAWDAERCALGADRLINRPKTRCSQRPAHYDSSAQTALQLYPLVHAVCVPPLSRTNPLQFVPARA